MSDNIVTRIDVDSSEALTAISALGKAYDRLETQTTLAAKSQAKYDAAVAKSGASSDAAVAAEGRLTAALKREQLARDQVAIAAAKDSEVQSRAATKVAAAEEAAAAKRAAALKKVGTVAGGVGLLAAAGLGAAAKAAANFDAKMAQVQTLTGSSAAQISALADASKQYAGIGISASQAADAEIELVKAGVSVKDILSGGLSGALNLAAAGQLSVADATSIASAAMTQFGLSGKDIPHIADDLAAGANKSLGSVQDLGEGLKAVGTTAHQAGFGLDETVGALAALAKAGLTAELGGTALKQMFLKLEAPSAKAKGLMDQYGISLYDASGHVKSLRDVAGELKTNLAGLDPATRNAALATIFGSRAVQAANVLYQQGSAGIANWTRKVNDSGAAARTTAGQMDSLRGDLQRVGAEITNAAIGFGQQLQPALREVAQDLSSVVRAGGEMPDWLKEAAALTIAFTAAVGLGAFAFTRVKTALQGLATTLGTVTVAEGEAGAAAAVMNGRMLLGRAGAAALGVGLLTLNGHIDDSHQALKDFVGAGGIGLLVGSINPVAGVVAGLGTLIYKGITQSGFHATASMEALSASIEKVGRAASALPASNVTKDLIPLLTTAGISVEQYNRALNGSAQAQGAVIIKARSLGGIIGQYVTKPIDDANAAQEAYLQHQRQLADDSDHTGAAIHHMGSAVDEFGRTIAGAGEPLKGFGADAKSTAADLDGLSASAKKALTAILALDNVHLGKQADSDAFAASIDAATAALKQNGRTLDQNTEKGRANRAVLRDIASSALTLAADFAKGSKGQVQALENGRRALYQQRIAFGDTKAEARAYVDQVLQIPDNLKTKTDFDYLAAYNNAKTLEGKYNDLDGRDVKTITELLGAASTIGDLQRIIGYENYLQGRHVETYVDTVLRTVSASGGHTVYGQAEGGEVRGAGTATSDSILRALSNGEFVIKTRSAERIGYGALAEMNRTGQIPPGLAGGGFAGRAPVASGTTRTVYMTDPALLATLGRVENLLGGRLKVDAHVNNPDDIAMAGDMRTRSAITAQRVQDARLGLPSG